MFRRLCLTSAMGLILLAGQASAESSKLDARARIALAQLEAGMPATQLRAQAQAVNESGALDVFIVGDVSRAELEAAGARVRTQAGRIFTAYVPADAVGTVAALPRVARIEGAALCDPELDQSVPSTNATSLRGAGPLFAGINGSGIVVGDVDTGVDYGHGDFKDAAGNTRFLEIWDQTDTGGPNPAGFPYGSEWARADIDANLAREVDTNGHGTHVLGIAGGDGSQTGAGIPAHTYAGMAPAADLIMVKTTSYATTVLDGVAYILQRAAALGRPAAVNLSLGSHYGPHDGTSAFETGLNALSGPGRIIVKSAGNERGSNIHAKLFAPLAGDSAKLTVANGATSGRMLAIDGYYGAGDDISITIRSPGNKIIGPISLGAANKAYPGDTTGVNGRVYVENGLSLTARGDREVYVEITSLGAGTGSISGTWTLTFNAVALGGTGRVDLWRYYVSTTSLTAAFSLKNTNENLVSEPGNADSLITTASWTTKRYWTDCGGRTLVNYTGSVNPGNLSPFSSPGPTRDGRQKPDLAAPGSAIGSTMTWDISFSCPTGATSLLNDGMNHQVMQGTSMAAPHVTGAAALVLQKFGAVSPAFVKALLVHRAVVDAYTGSVPNADWGSGKLWLGDLLDPTVTVIAPNGGEVFTIGSSQTLTWSASDNVSVASVEVRLSRSGPGGPFETLYSGPNTGSLGWTVSGPASDNCYLDVVARDAEGNLGSDASNQPFAILDVIVPTLLSRFDANPVGDGIELRWQYGQPQLFGATVVERAPAATGPWTAVPVEQRVEEGMNLALDRNVEPGRTYWYRLEATNGGDPYVFGPVQVTAVEVIHEFALSRPVPNPTSATARVDYAVPRTAQVDLSVFDMQGRRVATLLQTSLPAGRGHAIWNGTIDGQKAAAGVYFVRLRAPGVNLTRRLVIAR